MSMSCARRAFAAGWIVCAGWMAAAGAAHAGPSVDDFASYVDFGAVTLSPDGNRIAYTTHVEGQRALMVLDLEKRTNKAILAAEKDHFQISWCRFKTPQRLLCGLRGLEFFRGKPYPVSRLVAINADGSKFSTLVQESRNAGSQYQDRVLDWLPRDPKHVYMQLSPRNSSSIFPDVYLLDVENGSLTLVENQRYPIRRWFTDSAGVVRYGQGCDDKGRCEYVSRDSAKAPWRLLKRWEHYKEESDFSVLGFGPGDQTLLTTELNGDRLAVYQLDLSDKAEKELVFDHPQVDVGGAVEWPRTGQVVGFWYETDRYRRELFNADAAAAYTLVDNSLPDTTNYIIDTARDDKLLLIAAYSDVLPRQYFLLDRERKALSRISAIAPALAAAPLARMKPVKIQAPDGTTLPGYLTVPGDTEPKNLPLVMYPHGGPHARDSWGFDAVVQFLASRGYAVLQVNFRGSTGYGQSWFQAGLRKWGSVMVDDVNAATRWAIEQGIADPRRTCIVGWSFGGYAALMGAIREPEMYRCVVSIAGVSDLQILRIQDRRFYGGWDAGDHFIGTEGEELLAGSPLKATARIKAPVLQIHGTLDFQVDAEQSRLMNRALGSADKSRELVLIDDGDHSLSRYQWRKTLYTKLEEFLGKHLSGAPVTAQN